MLRIEGRIFNIGRGVCIQICQVLTQGDYAKKHRHEYINRNCFLIKPKIVSLIKRERAKGIGVQKLNV